MNNFEIAVVEPKYSMNIGSVARIMSCTGVDKLNVIRPLCDYKNPDARKFSLFGKDILFNATELNGLGELKNSGHMLFGFTRRLGKHRANPIKLTELGDFILKKGAVDKCTLVFGGESSGLSNEDIDCCDYIVHLQERKKNLVS